jgi:RNA polymerase sigma-70 factor, ECF subfamily
MIRHQPRPSRERLHLEQVERAIRALAPQRAEALLLRIFAGLSVVEVAQVIGTSEAEVRLLVHAAIRDLCVRLAFHTGGSHEKRP